MSFRASFHDTHAPTSVDFVTDGYAVDGYAASETLMPGEPIWAAADRQRGSTMLPAAICIAIMVFGGWAAWAYRSTLEPIWAVVTQIAAPLTQRPPPAERAPGNSATAAEAEPQPVQESREVGPAPGESAGTPVAALQPAEDRDPAPPELRAEPAAPERLPPPRIDPSDPHQKRAAAVGLHPDLSRALLARLTSADYRNAGIAIKTAMEAADRSVVVWPQNAGPKHAVFEVRFVHAAGPECRRYVVTVTKDRWQTTAPPMETCAPAARGHAGASAG